MKRNALRVFLFLLLTGAVLYSVQSIFCTLNDHVSYNSLTGFYELPRNSADAVVIGSSTVFEYFQPPVAYADHGIRVYSMTSPTLPGSAMKTWALEAHKTQPDALLILSLNSFRDAPDIPILRYHNAVDFLHFSKNKLDLIRQFGKEAGDGSFSTKLEFYFPLIRFHAHWNELTAEQIYRQTDGMMGGFVVPTVKSYEYRFRNTESVTEPDPRNAAALDELIETIRAEELPVLFLITPQLIPAEKVGIFNALQQTVEAAGFPCLNLQKQAAELTLDPARDFQNSNHTNIHGSLKVTEAVSQYLIGHYGFADRRNAPEDAGTAAWEEAERRFISRITRTALDFELEHAPQLLDLGPAEALTASAGEDGCSIRLSWLAPAEGMAAEGWAVFRKPEKGVWERIGEVSGDTGEYQDAPEPGRAYDYNVVPFRIENDAAAYGRWSNAGVSFGRFDPAPVLKELRQDDSGAAVLTWEPAASAKDFRVYRREGSGEWKTLGDTKELWWEDKTVLAGKTYSYSVSAVLNSGEGLRSETGMSLTMK